MFKYWLLTIFFSLGVVSEAIAQEVGFKTNVLYDATATINLGVEVKLGTKTTLELPVNYNPWGAKKDKKLKHFLVQPEIRHWTCQAFTGHFFGIHAHYAVYNIAGKTPFTYMKNHRVEGWLTGVGLSYGYHWILSDRWAVEATLGVGYAYVNYDSYGIGCCEPLKDSGVKHYFGPTKAGVSFIFMIK